MSANDQLFVRSNFENWKNQRGVTLGKVDPFVYYCADQILKPYDPTDQDIAYGITDGPNDGGVDALYFITNRSQFVQDDTVVAPRGTSSARLVIAQIKDKEEGFKKTEIEKMHSFLDDLLDLQRQTSTLTNEYHPHLLQIMQTFKDKYLQIASGQMAFAVEYYYVTRIDEITPDAKAVRAAEKASALVKKHLNKAETTFQFVNLQALLDMIDRRPAKEKVLTWAEAPMQARDGHVGLVNLNDYFQFISEENGELTERIFDANVRGFQMNTPVNKQIRETLRASDGANFWLVNNGITVVASSAPSAGHLKLKLMDPQVVNGLQTSREIHRHFTDNKGAPDSRAILVRVIETADDVLRDAVIKATNSQNKMDAASLRATDRIHHQIEEFFKGFKLFYDRRKGFYKDKGMPINSIVAVMDLVKGVVAILLGRPDDARARAGDYIKKDQLYERVFGKEVNGRIEGAHPLGAYLSCVRIMKKVEDFVSQQDGLESGDLLNVKFYVAAYGVWSVLDGGTPAPDDLTGFDLDKLDDAHLTKAFRTVWRIYTGLDRTDTAAKGPEMLKRLKAARKRQFRTVKVKGKR